MAVTLTEGAIAHQCRLVQDPAADVPADVSALLAPLIAWASLEVVAATVDGCPDAYHDQAVAVLVGYLVDVPPASRHTSYGNAWANSGAATILRRYLKRRAVAVTSTEAGA